MGSTRICLYDLDRPRNHRMRDQDQRLVHRLEKCCRPSILSCRISCRPHRPPDRPILSQGLVSTVHGTRDLVRARHDERLEFESFLGESHRQRSRSNKGTQLSLPTSLHWPEDAFGSDFAPVSYHLHLHSRSKFYQPPSTHSEAPPPCTHDYDARNKLMNGFEFSTANALLPFQARASIVSSAI